MFNINKKERAEIKDFSISSVQQRLTSLGQDGIKFREKFIGIKDRSWDIVWDNPNKMFGKKPIGLRAEYGKYDYAFYSLCTRQNIVEISTFQDTIRAVKIEKGGTPFQNDEILIGSITPDGKVNFNESYAPAFGVVEKMEHVGRHLIDHKLQLNEKNSFREMKEFISFFENEKSKLPNYTAEECWNEGVLTARVSYLENGAMTKYEIVYTPDNGNICPVKVRTKDFTLRLNVSGKIEKIGISKKLEVKTEVIKCARCGGETGSDCCGYCGGNPKNRTNLAY